LEAIDFITKEWSLQLDGSLKDGTATVDCTAFMTWVNNKRSDLRKYKRTRKSSEETNKLLDSLQV
jgi:hypothetical protein